MPASDDFLGIDARRALGETRRCTATNRKGERCGRAAILGGFVCSQHGGNAPQTRRRARERLLSVVEEAIESLVDAMRSGQHAVVVKAAQLILDRAGFHPSLTLKLDEPEDMPWAYYLTDEQLAQFAQWEAEARERMLAAEHAPLSLPAAREHLVTVEAAAVQEGVLVEDEEEEG